MRRAAAAAWLSAALALALECSSSPKYPACERDEQCDVRGKHDYCVMGRCAYCRTAADCGDRQRCRAGACEADPNAPPIPALDAGSDVEEAGDDEAGTDDQPEETHHFLPRGVRRLIHP